MRYYLFDQRSFTNRGFAHCRMLAHFPPDFLLTPGAMIIHWCIDGFVELYLVQILTSRVVASVAADDLMLAPPYTKPILIQLIILVIN